MKSKVIVCLLILVGLTGLAQHSGLSQKPDEKELAKKILNTPNELVTSSRQITFEGPRAGEGYFSSDGKKMIFQSERQPGNPFYQMYIMDLDSGTTQRISTGKGMTTCGWIHPNMKQAMWSSTHLDKDLNKKLKKELEERKSTVKKRYSWSFDENYSIFTSDLNGRNVKQLTKVKGYNAEGSYSPDGKYIAFASNRSAYNRGKLSEADQKRLDQDASYFMDIYIMDADGKNVRQLTDAAGYDGGPFFSADGKKITWRRFSENGMTAEIYTMNVDGTDQKKITDLGAMSWAPYFHPSGDYIVFGTSILGMTNFELFIVDTNGLQKPVRVSFAEGFDGLASFSPDGTKLTWSHRNDRGESQIYMAEWNDGLARKLLNLPEVKPLAASGMELRNLDPEITKTDTEKIIRYLASDYFQGRPTGGENEIEYVERFQKLFQNWGLKTEIQKFEFTSGVKTGGENKAELKGRFNLQLKLGEDFQLYSSSKTGSFGAAPIAFVGYGIVAAASSEQPEFDSYKDTDVNGKWVMFFAEAPKPAAREFKKHTHLMAFARMQHKISVAKSKGAAGIILVEDGKVGPLRFEGALSENHLPIVKISFATFGKIMASQPELKTTGQEIKEKYETYSFVPGFILPSQYLSATINLELVKSSGLNLVGTLNPVRSGDLKNPGLLIGAHGDHLGRGQFGSSLATGDLKNNFHYGADDNASGVSGVLELAHYFSSPDHLAKLRKPLTFAIWSGEEIGILGSSHFVKTYKDAWGRDFSKAFEAGLNMDMIGRLNGPLQIQGIGSAPQWPKIIERLAAGTDLSLVLTSDPYLPTDAMTVYVGKVASISFFTGAHLDYHTPNDTADKINYEGLVHVINVVKKTTESISQTPSRVVSYVQVEGNQSDTTGGNRGFKIFLGTIPDYTQEGIKGVRISGTAKNSPAELAGLKAGDVIVEFDKVQIENIYDYVYTLQTVKPDLKTQIKIKRDTQIVSLDIVPKLKE
jgi:Tol biopolymer transport system component